MVETGNNREDWFSERIDSVYFSSFKETIRR